MLIGTQTLKSIRIKTNLDVFCCRVLGLHTLTLDAWFSDGVTYPKLTWFSTDLLPKLTRWAAESKCSEFRSTLSLLPVEKYSLVYQQLKEKYKAMVKVKYCSCISDTCGNLSAASIKFHY